MQLMATMNDCEFGPSDGHIAEFLENTRQS